jgi:hypothetical protein
MSETLEKKTCEPRLRLDQLAPFAEKNSPMVAEAERQYDLVVQAAQNGDAEGALRLYEKAVLEKGNLLNALLRVLPMRTDTEIRLPPRENKDAFGSMERVALAAIELARASINGGVKIKLPTPCSSKSI